MAPGTTTAREVEQLERNGAALELLHQLGQTIETRFDPLMVERDWETEAYLDQWVGRYFRNIAIAYHEILRAPTIACLREALAAGGQKAHAVAVVGAGPSLDRNADALHEFPGLVVACDRAARALTARGIRPDLVVCVDPRAAVMADMVDYPENRFQRLVLSVYAHPEVARVWRGPRYYMSTLHEGTQFHDRVLPELFPGMPGLHATGNVGNAAVQLTDWLGGRKVVLVGQDYGYTGSRMACADYIRHPAGRWLHAPLTAEEEAARLAHRTGKVVVDGVATYGAFVGYRESLMQLVREWKLDVVNATEGGILTGLPQAPLAQVVEQLHAEGYTAQGARAALEKATGGLT